MRAMKICLIIAIAMALAVTLTIVTHNRKVEESPSVRAYSSETKTYSSVDHSSSATTKQFTSVKRVSRFLTDKNNSRASDYCHKDNEVCGPEEEKEEGRNERRRRHESKCCNKKCMNLKSHSEHCGACKNKCNYTHTCCNGECVDRSFDKRHCGRCFNRCLTGGYCIYGMCDYA